MNVEELLKGITEIKEFDVEFFFKAIGFATIIIILLFIFFHLLLKLFKVNVSNKKTTWLIIFMVLIIGSGAFGLYKYNEINYQKEVNKRVDVIVANIKANSDELYKEFYNEGYLDETHSKGNQVARTLELELIEKNIVLTNAHKEKIANAIDVIYDKAIQKIEKEKEQERLRELKELRREERERQRRERDEAREHRTAKEIAKMFKDIPHDDEEAKVEAQERHKRLMKEIDEEIERKKEQIERKEISEREREQLKKEKEEFERLREQRMKEANLLEK